MHNVKTINDEQNGKFIVRLNGTDFCFDRSGNAWMCTNKNETSYVNHQIRYQWIRMLKMMFKLQFPKYINA